MRSDTASSFQSYTATSLSIRLAWTPFVIKGECGFWMWNLEIGPKLHEGPILEPDLITDAISAFMIIPLSDSEMTLNAAAWNSERTYEHWPRKVQDCHLQMRPRVLFDFRVTNSLAKLDPHSSSVLPWDFSWVPPLRGSRLHFLMLMNRLPSFQVPVASHDLLSPDFQCPGPADPKIFQGTLIFKTESFLEAKRY